MEKLVDKLDSNTKALVFLDQKYDTIKDGVFFKIFRNESKQAHELNKVLEVKKRVLKMRFTLLENISLETAKQMHITSQISAKLTLQINE